MFFPLHSSFAVLLHIFLKFSSSIWHRPSFVSARTHTVHLYTLHAGCSMIQAPRKSKCWNVTRKVRNRFFLNIIYSFSFKSSQAKLCQMYRKLQRFYVRRWDCLYLLLSYFTSSFSLWHNSFGHFDIIYLCASLFKGYNMQSWWFYVFHIWCSEKRNDTNEK